MTSSTRRAAVGRALAAALATLLVVTLLPVTAARAAGSGPTEYVPVAPIRVVDTRESGLLAAREVLKVPITGRHGVPTDASAVVLNVTVTEPKGSGFVTAYPCGSPRPTASNLNYTAGQTIPNAVIAGIGSGGAVCFYTSVSTHIVVDVNGWSPTDAEYTAMAPVRAIDTRPTGGPAAGGVLRVPLAGRAGIPADASAVVLNVTVTEPKGSGFATAYPCGSPRPTASNLNYTAGQTIPNAVIAGIGTGGAVCLYTSVATDLVVDVNGWFPADADYTAMAPVRAADTRNGTGVQGGQVPAGRVLTVPIAGRHGVPADASAVVLNVTVTEPRDSGFVTAYPCGSPRPTASNLNSTAGQTIPNAVIAGIGTGGAVCLYTSVATHIVVDVNGWFPAPTAPPPAVTSLRTSEVTATSVSLAWTNPQSPELSSVVVRRSAGATPPTTPTEGVGVRMTVPTAQSATDTGLTPEHTYSYAVFTMDAEGNHGLPTTVTVKTPDPTPPRPVSGPHVTKRTDASIELSWGNPDDRDLERVTVRRAIGDSAPATPESGIEVRLSGTLATAALDTGLADATRYSYSVFAQDASGNWSTAAKVTTSTWSRAPAMQQVTAGSCALDLQGKAWCWGHSTVLDESGQPIYAPAQPVPGDRSYSAISQGAMHTCALDTGGAAWCWGYNGQGQLGDGEVRNDTVAEPVSVAGGHRFEQITANAASTCGLDAAGGLWCWGDMANILGPGAGYNGTPASVADGLEFEKVALASHHTCGIDREGAAWCWGSNNQGELGTGSQTDSWTPQRVLGDRQYIDIATGSGPGYRMYQNELWFWKGVGSLGHTCAIDTSHRTWCWGANPHGELGDGTTGAWFDGLPVYGSLYPKPVDGVPALASITAAGATTCGYTVAYGSRWCWGDNYYSTLGGSFPDQSTTPRPAPTTLHGISMTEGMSCGLDSTGAAWCWGTALYGKIGDGTVAGPGHGDRQVATEPQRVVAAR